MEVCVLQFTTSFLIVVPQYYHHIELDIGPSQNRTCAVNASGSQLTPVTPGHTMRAIAIKSVIRPGSANGLRCR